MPDDDQFVNDAADSGDDYDPDNPDYHDVDEMIEDVTGNKPEPGEPYSIADEVSEDEADH